VYLSINLPFTLRNLLSPPPQTSLERKMEWWVDGYLSLGLLK
jgi:hypothetical protein